MRKRTDLINQYFNPIKAGSLGGVQKISKATRTPIKSVKDWLSYERAYTIHKPRRIHFPRNRMYVTTVDEHHQADLVDLQSLAPHNANIKYLLVIIDVLSRYIWVEPLKKKSGPEVAAALDKVYGKGRSPTRLSTDLGKEFMNKHVKAILNKYKIHFYVSYSDKKAAMVERLNRTLKNYMWRWFTKNHTYHYLEALPKIVHSYNHTKHRVIGTTPASVTINNEHLIWYRLFGNEIRRKDKPRFSEGDCVRVSNPKTVFDKGYKGNYSEEVFIISRVLNRVPVVYHLKDKLNEPILGIFYEAELQKVRERTLPDGVYEVERVLKRKKKAGKEMVLVKWRGYNDQANSWIRATELKTYQ